MMNNTTFFIAAASIAAITFLSITGAFLSVEKAKTEKPAPQAQAQKFRFGEQCPDGLRVEYVNTVRLPKSVVCQQPVGE